MWMMIVRTAATNASASLPFTTAWISTTAWSKRSRLPNNRQRKSDRNKAADRPFEKRVNDEPVMNRMRRGILALSQNQWMREHVQDAVTAARLLAANGMQSVLSRLGENVADRAQAAQVTRDFLELNDRIRAAGIPAEITVKLTQLGLDLDPSLCYENLATLIQNTPAE